MNTNVESAARRFVDRLRARYDVAGAVLYGSRARGDADDLSDVDLAVLLGGPQGNRADAAVDMAGIAFDLMLDTGILVDPLPIWLEEWKHPAGFANQGLIETIRRDGIPL
ncbi:nucleotidyltransferase domain-containing protein [Thiocapsa bogorovii]|uniref:nucleotidyltransferase domain-containing protein n=1 Tax=Thiocapsa bogorovii TaxID=521689 RepID=UPI001E42F05A|nr:nucleotidyltransferase domain-containing protein [Thiocapsa bogorovii]UHD14455.1 nucleotidyltransferase domain-containing protein [Thiocapsa bogorovii]